MFKKLLLLGILIELGVFGYMIQVDPHKLMMDQPFNKTHLKPLTLPTPSTNTDDQAVQTFHIDQLDAIKQKYRNQMEVLEQNTGQELNRLIEDGISGLQDGVDLAFVLEMKTKVKELAAGTDQKFNQLYKQLEAELMQNGYSKDEANVFKEEYEQKKDSFKSSLLQFVVSQDKEKLQSVEGLSIPR